MAALRKRIAKLEGRLASQEPAEREEHEEVTHNILDFPGDDHLPDWNDFNNMSLPTSNNTSVGDTETSFSNFIASTTAQSMPMTMASLTSTPVTTASLTTAALMPVAPLTPATTVSIATPQLHTLGGFIPAELDQLYFERVHPAVPLLQQRTYLSWSRKDIKKKSQLCLQHAMWTLAALQSAQYRYLQETLYRSCTQMLTSICLSDSGQDPFDTEQIQAWLLITVYELMRSFHRQAWMSVGRAFRLLQLLRYHELDNPALGIPEGQDFIEREEQRRAFWMAYVLDHLFGVSNNWPITLNELVVCTRLPFHSCCAQNFFSRIRT
ncbi:Ascochitine biosynthesis cluster transcriptional regulator [Ascochyta lentis]